LLLWLKSVLSHLKSNFAIYIRKNTLFWVKIFDRVPKLNEAIVFALIFNQASHCADCATATKTAAKISSS
jgi:hypothetical protein